MKPPPAAGLSLALITDDASTGISATKFHTHAISGGAAVTVNGVAFDVLTGDVTPLDFSWDQLGGSTGRGANAGTPGDWDAAAGGVTGPGIIELLNSFVFPFSREGYQDYVIRGLTPGQTYELSIFIRAWDWDGPGRPIDLSFINGTSTVEWFGPLTEDHVYSVIDGASEHAAYVITYAYTAEGTDVVLEGFIPLTEDPASVESGGFHLYGLTNAVDEGAGPADLLITSASMASTGGFTIKFTGGANTSYQVTKSTGLIEAFAPLTTPLTVMTDGSGVGSANVPAAETGDPKAFFRVEGLTP